MSFSDGGFHFVDLPNGWTVGRFGAMEELDGVAHVVTTRKALDVRLVADDRAAAAATLAKELGLAGAAFCRQVHGNEVVAVADSGPAGDADAMLTAHRGLGLMALSADCPLILLADPVSGTVGTAHASWRGTVARIAPNLVLEMVSRFDASCANMVACICPSAGPCCYKVGQDVADAAISGIGPHAEGFFLTRGGATYFDLWRANAAELVQVGLRRQNVHVAGVCTICRNDVFPSYRVEGASAGRFAAVIGRT